MEHREAAYLQPAEVRALLVAASGGRYAPLFEFMVNTAMRRGEALALTWADVDQEKKFVRVRGTLARVDGQLSVTEPKSARSRRVVPLSETALQVLKQLRTRQRLERLAAGSVWQSSGYVFTTELGGPCDPRNALRALKSAA